MKKEESHNKIIVTKEDLYK